MGALKERRLVITGIGPLSSIGIGKDDLWLGVSKKKQGVSLEKYFLNSDYFQSLFIYKIKDFNIREYGINKQALEELNRWKEGEENIDLYYFLAAIKLALDDSRLQVEEGYDVGLVLSHENPGLEQFYSSIFGKSFKALKDDPRITKEEHFRLLYSDCAKSAYDLQTFMFLFHAAKTFNIHGFSLFINNACASGLYAIETASQLIKSGKNNIVIVAAVDNPGIYRHLWLKKQGLYAEDGKIKPFAKNCNGFVLGQGGAALVLEEWENAKKRRAHIYAEYLGGGFFLESWKVTMPNINQNFYGGAIVHALKQSRVKPKEIDLINAHGVATKIIDQYEAKTIREIYGELKNQPFINAFKPYVGHNLGGCALLETAMLLLALENNTIPPVLNCEEFDSNLKINIVRETISKKIKTVLKISCGFGGFDGAAIFRKV